MLVVCILRATKYRKRYTRPCVRGISSLDIAVYSLLCVRAVFHVWREYACRRIRLSFARVIRSERLSRCFSLPAPSFHQKHFHFTSVSSFP